MTNVITRIFAILTISTLAVITIAHATPCDGHFPSNNTENIPIGIGTMSYQLLCSEEYGITIDRWKTVLYLQNYVYTDNESLKKLGKDMRNERLKRCKGQGTSCADNMGTELIYGTKNKLRSMVNKSTCQNLRP